MTRRSAVLLLLLRRLLYALPLLFPLSSVVRGGSIVDAVDTATPANDAIVEVRLAWVPDDDDNVVVERRIAAQVIASHVRARAWLGRLLAGAALPYALFARAAGGRGEIYEPDRETLGCCQSHQVVNENVRGDTGGAWRPLVFLVIGTALGSVVSISRRSRGASREGLAVKEEPPASLPAIELAAGDEALLELPGGKGVWMALDDEAWIAIRDARRRKNLEEITLLMASGRMIRELNGTRVEVLRTSDLSIRVGIRDGCHQGVEAWVERAYVRSVLSVSDS